MRCSSLFFALAVAAVLTPITTKAQAPREPAPKDEVSENATKAAKFAAIPDAPPAAETAKKRQLQMRSLARKFSGALADRNEDAKFTQLRLMAKPLYQYESTGGPDREGAVFALVTTNDPEILLIIESRAVAEGREWVYAAARMHYCRLQLK